MGSVIIRTLWHKDFSQQYLFVKLKIQNAVPEAYMFQSTNTRGQQWPNPTKTAGWVHPHYGTDLVTQLCTFTQVFIHSILEHSTYSELA